MYLYKIKRQNIVTDLNGLDVYHLQVNAAARFGMLQGFTSTSSLSEDHTLGFCGITNLFLQEITRIA